MRVRAPIGPEPAGHFGRNRRRSRSLGAVIATLAAAVACVKPLPARAETAPDIPRPAAAADIPSQSPLGDDELYMRHPLLMDPDAEADSLSEDPGGDPFERAEPVIEPLEVIAWDLASAVAVGLLAEHEVIESTWRHTFGAQLRAFDRPRLAGAGLSADFVLLQNLASVSEVRQLFPARQWNVIFTRAMLEAERDGRPQRRGDLAAIAYRYRRGLRITATEEFSPPDSRPGPAERTAGLAVRFSHFGDVFWLVTANLPENCALHDAACEPAKALKAWRDALDDGTRRTVTGGVIARSVATPGATPPASSTPPTAPPAKTARQQPQDGGGWLFGWFSGREKIEASTAPPRERDPQPRTADKQTEPPAAPDCTRLEIALTGEAPRNAVFDENLGCLARYTLQPPARRQTAIPARPP